MVLGELLFHLEPGREQAIALTSEVGDDIEIGELVRRERARRVKCHEAAKDPNGLAATLRRGADTFLVHQGSKQTVIAGILGSQIGGETPSSHCLASYL